MPHNEKYQQMDIVFNTINEGIIITDKNGNIIYINKIAIKILKIPNDDILGQNISRALPFCKLLLKTLQTGKNIFIMKFMLKNMTIIIWLAVNHY